MKEPRRHLGSHAHDRRPLALKDMTWATLVRKLCAHSGHPLTRRALLGFDRLIWSPFLREDHMARWPRPPPGFASLYGG